MGYPDTFEGFQVTSHKHWSDFKKQEVRSNSRIPLTDSNAYTRVVQAETI